MDMWLQVYVYVCVRVCVRVRVRVREQHLRSVEIAVASGGVRRGAGTLS